MSWLRLGLEGLVVPGMDSGNASLCEGPYEELFRALEEGKVDIDIEVPFAPLSSLTPTYTH